MCCSSIRFVKSGPSLSQVNLDVIMTIAWFAVLRGAAHPRISDRHGSSGLSVVGVYVAVGEAQLEGVWSSLILKEFERGSDREFGTR